MLRVERTLNKLPSTVTWWRSPRCLLNTFSHGALTFSTWKPVPLLDHSELFLLLVKLPSFSFYLCSYSTLQNYSKQLYFLSEILEAVTTFLATFSKLILSLFFRQNILKFLTMIWFLNPVSSKLPYGCSLVYKPMIFIICFYPKPTSELK